MGRKIKKGLNYFTLDVSFSDSIKLATIEAGNNVIPVLIELWQKIYGSHGYYMDFQEDNKLLFISSALTKITLDELEKLMQVFFKRGIFSKQIYEKYQILTSDSIQERYVESCIISKRQNTIIYSEYLCYEIMPEDAEKFVIRSINEEKIQFIPENSGINEENSGIIPENSGKSTYKIDRKNSIDILNTNSGKNQEKNNYVLPTPYSQIPDELKNNSKTKMFCIQTYKIKEQDYTRFIDWFMGLNSDHSDNEIVDFKEWNKHFKEWMKFNYDKLPKESEITRPKAKLL